MVFRSALATLLAVILVAISHAAPPNVPKPVARAMQDRDYAKAIEQIDDALEDPQADRPHLLYLKGRAQHYLERYEAAVETFNLFDKQHADSRMARRVRFAKAVALLKMAKFKQAEEIYRNEAEFLLSEDRKQDIAEIYLEFANALFEPADRDQEPDYKKAIEFFNKALEVGPKPDQREVVELRIGQAFQQLKDFVNAGSRFAKFIKAYPDSSRDIEARFRLGECRLAMNQGALARRTWEDLLAQHPKDESPRLAEAAFNLGRTFGSPPSSATALNLATARLTSFIEKYPEHKLAGQAWQQIGEWQMHHGRHAAAAAMFTAYLADPQHADREETPMIRFKLGMALQLQKEYDKAIGVWQDYLVKHPAHSNWSNAQQLIVDTEYLKAQEQRHLRNFAAARNHYLAFLAKYPLDGRAADTLFLAGRMNFELEKWDAAISDWRRVIAKYPNTEAAGRSQRMIGMTLESKLGKFGQALDEYKKLTWSNQQQHAKQRIALLTSKQLTLRTDRVFRGTETPQIRVTTRNIERLNVRAYRIDLETYFRKMHLASGVEQLDISLIDPDHAFEFEVPDFAKYRQAENRIDLAVAKDKKAAPGDVLVVTVSGQTLEATTMVLQSDLDIVVKSSRDELFVFAQNMRTGKPWPGARLLISNGKQVFAEAATGDDGVLQASYAELKSADDVRVFAISGGNAASNVIGLQGIGVAQGLADKGYVYTDRPAYRPGQLVNVRGVVRKVAADKYTVEEGKAFDMTVLDNRGRQVWTENVSLNKFGSFHARFALPAGCPVGTYRIQLTDNDQQNYAGTFVVHKYKLENIQLTIDTPRTVYYRGETIEGTIRVSYYYGSPVAGREVRYRLSDGSVRTGRTDAKGEVPFQLETRDFHEMQNLSLVAELPDLGYQPLAKTFVIASQGYSLSVDTPRPVYLSGESFEVNVKAADAEGNPAGRKLSLRVFEQTNVGGGHGERLVLEKDVATAAETGEAKVALVLKQGATYILRAIGTDRFDNPVTGQHSVRISGDDDSVRLRVLASRHTFKVGETPKIKIHWREKPALALVTFQGARVLDYRLVPLKTGSNSIDIPMTAELAPNFDLDVCVMTDAVEKKDGQLPPRFHQASSPFTVERQLIVKVEPQVNGAVRPGQPVEVKITTTDPQGKPVAAEVSLALVEKSLLDRFSESAPAIQDFFRGNRRQSAVRTTASISFSYAPQTTGVSQDLLAYEGLQQLHDLVENAVAPDSWDDVGGPGQIKGFPSNLSLQVVQGQQVEMFGSNPVRVWSDEFLSPRLHQYDFGADGNNNGTVIQENLPALGRLLGVTAAFPDGRIANYELAFRQQDEFEKLVEQVAREGGVLLALRNWQETGYWNPGIQTSEKGEATISLTVPDRSTAWKLLAKGISTETVCGQSDGELISRKDLIGELKLPRGFTDGDAATVEATIQNAAVKNGEIKVTLKTTIGGKTATQSQTIPVKDAEQGSTHVTSFDVAITRPAESDDRTGVHARFELVVESGERTDSFVRSIPIQPFGMPIIAAASGTASGDATARVEFPENVSPESPRMNIIIGPSIESGLLDIVFGARLPMPSAPTAEATAADLMAAISLQGLLWKTRDAAHPQAESLDRRIRGAVSSLISQQADDGGWTWCSGKSNRYVSARVLWALSLAKNGSYAVPDDALSKAIHLVQSEVAKTSSTDYESKSVLLQALAVAGNDDFPLANRLYRNRMTMSTSALLYLALAFAEMDRQPVAVELLDIVAGREFQEVAPRRESDESSLPWNQAPVELRALYTLALQMARPGDPRVKQSVDWLMEHRTANRWSPAKATGPASSAVCRWFGQAKFEDQDYKLKVLVNDQEVADLNVDGAAGSTSLSVPSGLLKKGQQRVQFQLVGRGTFSYQCLLEGFVPAERLKSSTDDWRVERTWQPAQLERDGRTVPRGFDNVAGPHTPFRNPLTQLPVARRGQVSLRLWRDRVSADTPDEHLEYLVVTEPLPAGVTVVEGSVQGSFERYETSAGAITFFVGQGTRSGTIQYEVYGYLAGKYRAAPTVVRDAYRPERYAVHEPKSLAILPLGATSKDAYQLTPVELFSRGKRSYDRREWADCSRLLAELTGGGWKLKTDTTREATRMLLDAHLEIGPAGQVVRHFETIKEKWPRMQIPYAKILKIGRAYEAMGEFERGYLIFRATVESSFLTESRVAGFLQSQDELLRSVNVMEELLLHYPPEPYVANAEFDLAQSVYGMADKAEKNARLREKKVGHDDLVRSAIHQLDNFLTAYPVDPAADKAAFSLTTGQLELRSYQAAIDHCSRCVERYADSDDVDSFWYTIGYCQFALGQHDAALATCRKVSEMKRRDPDSGVLVDAANRLQSIYILGQIYHSLGEAAKAIGEYDRVKKQFADAAEAIDFFARRDITLPEVSAVAPGKPVEIDLQYRNIARAVAKVYRIDLMKFGLLKRNLQGIANINLAGVRPFHETEIELGDGKDYADKSRKLTLPIKDEGAWLVVCRGDDLHASGLVLVSPLAVEIQEDATSGRVRTTVKDRSKDAYIPDIHVKVIGSANAAFVSGETDLRGVFVADNIRGTSTVIAQAEPGRYAFYRGTQQLGPVDVPVPNAPEAAAAAEPPAQGGNSKSGLLDNLFQRNDEIQTENSMRQGGQYFNDESGVRIESIKGAPADGNLPP